MDLTAVHTDALVSIARRLAEHHHRGQVDKAGDPYLGHVCRVAEAVVPQEPEFVAAALLHDILEDTAATPADLVSAGIPETVIEAVVILTKTGGPLDDYYAQVRTNAIALAVKLADVADNSDPSRLAQLDPEIRDRLTRKYTKALAALKH